jgi:hypothetical protein
MLYPHWGKLDTIRPQHWLRAGQLCLCSEDPTQSGNRLGIDCWMGDRWSSNHPWQLAIQLPTLDDPAWVLDASVLPTYLPRPVVLAVQASNYSGFRLGRYGLNDQPCWFIYNTNRWEPIEGQMLLGWLPIPSRSVAKKRYQSNWHKSQEPTANTYINPVDAAVM